MRLAVSSLAATTLGWTLSCATEVRASEQAEQSKAPAAIVITINPEARVSVAGSGATYRELACDEPIDLPVRIINMGFFTGQLEARITEVMPAASSVLLLGSDLTGVPEEQRVLRLSVKGTGFIDVTIAFRAKYDIEDLGGRSRVHLLLECRSPRSNE